MAGKQINVYNGYGVSETSATGTQTIGQDSFLDSNILSQAFQKYSTDKTQSVYMMDAWQKWEFTNSSNAPCVVDFYVVTPRHSIQGSTVSTGFNDPMTAWNTGLTQEGDTAPLSSLQPRSSPLVSKAFTDNYVVRRKMTVKMQPGGVHYITFKLRSPFRINAEEILSLNTGASLGNLVYPALLKGRTYFLMWAASGSPVKVMEGADAGKYTTSEVEIGHIFTSQWVIKAINPNNTAISDVSILANVDASQTKFINKYTGDAEAGLDL